MIAMHKSGDEAAQRYCGRHCVPRRAAALWLRTDACEIGPSEPRNLVVARPVSLPHAPMRGRHPVRSDPHMRLDLPVLLLLGALVITLVVVVALLIKARGTATVAGVDADALRARLVDAIGERDRAVARAEADQQRFAVVLNEARQEGQIARATAMAEVEAERARVRGELAKAVQDADTSRAGADADATRLRQESVALDAQIATLRAELSHLDEEASIQSFGFYKARYDFVTSAAYQARLNEVQVAQGEMLRLKTAALGAVEWTVNGSKVEGRKQINQTLKLMLRAFNGECDAAVVRVRFNNVAVMEARIRKGWETVNTLAAVQQCHIVPEYLDLRLQELFLAHEYQEKVQAEREKQRSIREQMRDDEIAQREMERAREDAEREEQRYAVALDKARTEIQQAVGANHERLEQQILELERRLTDAHARKERAIARAQLTRSGHVYVISNVGSFGDEVYKIGMTRRLDPNDRIRELGDASVPFTFDVHAVIYADDAPALENKLHRLFHWRRVNGINERKEFFRVSIDEIAAAIRAENAEIEIIKDAAAQDFRKTLALRAEEASRGAQATDGRISGPSALPQLNGALSSGAPPSSPRPAGDD